MVYYQSSGVARHAQTGQAAAIGPAALLLLDTRTAQLSTVLEDRGLDSNGFAVFRLVDGDWQEVVRANLIETVCVA